MDFTHLHVHSQYSLLDGAASISGLMKKAKADNMKAIALTDHGNMFGAFNFVAEANKYNIKPIVGCEFYVVHDRFRKEFTKGDRDNRYHQLLLAKDHEGYKNLSKLCSQGYIDGLYSKWPRIDKELILKYHKGLIATTCCIGAEVPQAIINKSEAEAEEVFKWWLDIFGEDYYIELQRHGLKDIDNSGKSQEDVNQVLLKWAAKYGVNVIATNDSHYIEQEDWTAHDILLCVNTGELQKTPVGDGKGFRFGFPNDQFYFKTQEEMTKLFSDVPQAIDNTNEIVDKIEHFKLTRDILLPNFSLPEAFTDPDEYLKHLAFEGAKKRYTDISPEIEERLNYELHIIKTMGFAGYFLIVQDFIAAGKNMGVAVGPGRGSAAGSSVAYCIGITNIDPIKYNLLFERFLNPERVSMPDIDIDFDDEGREKVIQYVVEKYGKNQVAQIITFGTMAARSSIKDVARVLDLPLAEANYLAKMVPETPGATLKKAYEDVPDLKKIKESNSDQGKVLQLAQILEGSVRNTGIHAAGVIIAPDDITNYIPVSTSKDSDLLVTQFDGKLVESAGMLKMDFLGLKTLSIIRDALFLIKKNHGDDIDIDNLPLEDPKTFELYQRGDTIGTFQFESDGMRKYLKELKPTNIEDLIAMNALYRPGPMDYIPLFISRKHGKEKVEYPHELLEDLLKHTYGIMVYQEQIMQTAQIIAGYSLGGADLLRRAMGKKDKEKMAKERVKFVDGAQTVNDIGADKANDIFNVMEKFAEYGFNRSHSAAYSVVAYQTAYLKANYPAEYMAAVLTHSMNNIEKISFFMDECNRQKIPLLGPDVNESALYFDVNKEGKIRFGMAAIKGAGEAAVEAIISERDENGPYSDIFNFVERVNLRTVNKKTFESLAQAGAFDALDEIHRAQYFFTVPGENITQVEKIIRYGTAFQSDKAGSQQSLFGGGNEHFIQQPKILDCARWNKIEELKKEKEMVGFFISGHPLDDYRFEIERFLNCTCADFENFNGKQQVIIGGIVTKLIVRKDKNNNDYGIVTLEDFSGSTEIRFWRSTEFLKYQHMLQEGKLIILKGERKPRFYNSTEMETSWTDVFFLAEAAEKMTKKISLQVALENISPDLNDRLSSIFSTHTGNVPVKIQVTEPLENLNIIVVADKYKLQPSNELIRELNAIREVEMTVN
jgi:DNA polymerase III subunit alpha